MQYLIPPLEESAVMNKDVLLQLANTELARAANMKQTGHYEIDWAKSKIRTPEVRTAASALLKRLRSQGVRDIDEIFRLCEPLLSTGSWPYRTMAFQWSFSFKKQFEPRHFPIFEHWVKDYVTSWGSCDDLCTHSLGFFLLTFPEFMPTILSWTESSQTYVRRASAVSLIYGLRRGEFLEHVFQVADRLLYDSEDHVLKGYGWMLKEATQHFPDEVFEYVMAHKEGMPRVSLRYAIEKLPPKMKKRAMA
ncbi:DNA alkylation repair protein [Candidatus Thorarchaeota archaeon]|nr:MAG: DNA alkylation repair protein [Candidatus Thorarchaeota archaeon]